MMPKPSNAAAERACAAKRCEEAIHALESDLNSCPADALLCYTLGFCYSGGCRAHTLVSPEMASAYLRRALILAGQAAFLRASILDTLANTLVRCTDRPKAAALRDAIACHTEAAALFRAAGNSHDCARAQFNLGNSCCELSEATGEDHWREAVGHYESALQVRTRKQDPLGYAAVLENLGTAYRRLSSDGVYRAIQCYRRALRVCPRAAYPARNAALENNLGNALLSLTAANSADAGRNARRALRHFNRALDILAGGSRNCTYAITQYNRAQAYLRLAGQHSRAAGTAVDCLEDAFTVFQACGEQNYASLIRSQLERIGGGACEHGSRHGHPS